MARPKSFDEETVLDAAAECFRRHGLNAASVRELADEMGIAGPSLYNAFGCKRALFISALERYVDCGMRCRFAELEQRGPKAAINAFITEFIAKASCDAGDSRCLLINTAMEVDPSDADLAQRIDDYLQEIQTFFRRNLAAAQGLGEVPAGVDPDATAAMLLAVLLGVGVLARATRAPARLDSMVASILALLDTPLSMSKRS